MLTKQWLKCVTSNANTHFFNINEPIGKLDSMLPCFFNADLPGEELVGRSF